MRFLLRKKKEGKEVNAGKVTGIKQMVFAHLQNRWATWMNRHTQTFSRNTWKLLLVLFVLTAGGYSIYLTIDAFFNANGKSISIIPIKKPAHINETGDAAATTPSITDAGYSHIKNFRLYMDSLARSPSGKIIYDSIIMYRPGLMDSIRMIEKYYQQQKQK